MILAVARNRLMSLTHDRAAFVLAFVLPVAFFTIFAAIFGRSSERTATRRIPVAVVDEDGSENSRRFVAALRAEKGLRVLLAPGEDRKAPGQPYSRQDAEAAVRGGDISVALVIPRGFGERPISFEPGIERPRLTILADSSDPIAPQVLAGLVQKVAMTAMPDALARSGMEALDRFGGGLTPEQRSKMEENLGWLRRHSQTPSSGSTAAGPAASGLIDVETRDLMGETKSNPTVAFLAAGLGVMFLLFSAAGAGGALIEEVESGTLDRILSTRVSMSKLLLGKLLYLAGIAAVQLTVMFLWGSLVFGLELRKHLAGFTVMTVATALACSTYGLLLASICRTRMQLVAVANLTILTMSALGGSMFPRYLMPEGMQKAGLVTINAWAIDGFQKVFWREEPLWRLWPQVAALLGVTVLLLAFARRIARRWEIA
jgi:ABC-2 type transport system permease protein